MLHALQWKCWVVYIFCNRGNKTIYCTFCCFLRVSFCYVDLVMVTVCVSVVYVCVCVCDVCFVCVCVRVRVCVCVWRVDVCGRARASVNVRTRACLWITWSVIWFSASMHLFFTRLWSQTTTVYKREVRMYMPLSSLALDNVQRWPWFALPVEVKCTRQHNTNTQTRFVDFISTWMAAIRE